jgi:hypothetical protein
VILPLQTSFFEDYLGEGAETCGTGDDLVKASLFFLVKTSWNFFNET